MTSPIEQGLAPFIHAIRQKIRENIESFCFGCRNDKPSQIDHDICLMMDSSERFNLMFDVSWFQQDLDQILSWIKEVIKKKMVDDLDETE